MTAAVHFLVSRLIAKYAGYSHDRSNYLSLQMLNLLFQEAIVNNYYNSINLNWFEEE